MKVTYPLSLKVSLWLMLNLLLLAALAIGFLVVQGGMRWDALVAGPSGDRIQSVANIIAGELSATTSEARRAVLKRFSTAYSADFYLFTADEVEVSGSPVELPVEVRTRMGPFGFRPGSFGRGGRRGGRADSDAANPAETAKAGAETIEKGPPPQPDIEPKEGSEKSSREPSDKRRSGPDAGRREPPPFRMTMGEQQSGRFVVRAGVPAAYWVGVRVPFTTSDRPYPIPARVVARVGSLWSLLHLLNLQSWLLAGTAVLVLSVIFWLPLVRGITRSVGQLTAATEQIAEGHFEARVNTRRRDELGKLGESVNRMATRLDAHLNGQKRFLGDVAHELCSPLARLQMATGILTEQAPQTLQETVTDVREEVQQMSTLVNELLAFTKAGLRPREVVRQAVEIAPVAREVLVREDVGGRVTMTIADSMQAVAEPELLGRALANLIRNALRYAGEPGAIALTASRDGDRVIIAVEDEGPGVPAADLDRLGEPFFRPELARTRESGGVGLGLAIVRNSIAACGGEVRFSNRTPRGFRAEIRLLAA